ncbi:S8 family peptidase [Pyxidicoccus parkwayensis]|uniref:S8 family peptidase n=1 Tax=Pyxidicoccus parkwayensis TaxID=2813578 RepID=A0ABX7NRB1_9BACT|nr:S8 family peptidase [Pyxidicoccus parkwaysis]QSQ21407.1 S8 family peptidase [Pyxidicoccus parkwaysis]
MANRVDWPHLFVEVRPESLRFTSPKAGGGGIRTKGRNRAAHGAHLKAQFEAALPSDDEDDLLTLRFEFESEPDFDLKLESLEVESKGIELLNVRHVVLPTGTVTLATVLVPRGQLKYFLKLFEDYLTRTRGKNQQPANKSLVESIAHVRRASVRSLWTDPGASFPEEDGPLWWEVWLRRTGNAEAVFRTEAREAGLMVSQFPLTFADRIVLNLHATVIQLSHLLERDALIAELRRTRLRTAEFLELSPREQAAWTQDLLKRVSPPPPSAPAVCILDTGVNRGHPLLGIALPVPSVLTVDPRWRSDDHHGHGTQMAGLALYGDLGPLLGSNAPVPLRHGLESVKILPGPGSANAPELYGAVTQEAAARVEVQAPERARTFCMAVTGEDGDGKGSPSSWSSAVDQLAFGDEDGARRLLCVSAGNIEPEHLPGYPARNEVESVRDPAQAWNALTVGAFADRDVLTEKDYAGWKSMAPLGGLCPSSTTSVLWTNTPWPLKPEIVMPGGNAAIDPEGKSCDFASSLCLLTTHHQPLVRHLTDSRETSAATALAAGLAARVQAQYPRLWPETVRALLVHSAEWTEAMKARLSSKTKRKKAPKPKKKQYEQLLRMFGHGVPDERAALYSAADALTLIVQDELQPYGVHPKRKNELATQDMHVHALPWPTEVLRELGETEVELRVTLSYFIEPLPGDRGYAQSQRHRYASHGLRFELKTATETPAQFKTRINQAMREEGEEATSESDSTDWMLGANLRSAGSIHSDRWRGTAADLAEKGHLAVYPTIGWWKERPRYKRWENRTRYALVVSIRTPGVATDVYTPVAIQLGIPITT